MAEVKTISKLVRRTGGSTQEALNEPVLNSLAEAAGGCIGHAFGNDCSGPQGHDHGWMRHEQDCFDASEHDWDYELQGNVSTGVKVGTLKDPRTKLCLATKQAPYIGSMALEPCKPDDRTQLWSKAMHQNHVTGFGVEQADVTEYFNAADGAAVDYNCQGKCFRLNVCTDSKLYKLWVHDSDIPPIPFPDKIPDDPLSQSADVDRARSVAESEKFPPNLRSGQKGSLRVGGWWETLLRSGASE
eukprot:CAMPEP_0181293082 /NCGR_PEP_ID=MMETSP1101-20121128/2870_1 /TAXON_ID=46948 /ORGANISM="Rhodomonas abbreviata, Strain Caron Lab Isolate" /LENGTH=242 /DNA_ID=CAMNT_0023397635 /DNA_START=461 /DNA_END=1190 /DNA_ORIENTATION=-